MHGNVWEWIQDCWHKDYKGAPSAGSAWTSKGNCAERVLRSGSWYSAPRGVRSASRSSNTAKDGGSDIGFRVVRYLP